MVNVEELLIKLTADNKDLKNKLNQSENDVKGFSSNMTKIGTAAVAAFAVAGAAVLAFGVAGFKAAEQQEKANKRLLFALKGNTVAFKELAKQAEDLRAKTGVDDVAIMQIQQLGANAGYTTDKIKKITQASVELSAVTGQDLQAAYMQINQTYNGTAGRLTRLDAEFGTLTETQLRNGEAIDLILKKYTGFAAESATATEKLASNWGEFMEAAGGTLAVVINPALEQMSAIMTEINNKRGFWQKMGTLFSSIVPGSQISSSLDALNMVNDSKGVNGSATYQRAQKAESERADKMAALDAMKAARLAGKKSGGGAKAEKDPFLMMPEEIQGSLDGLVQYITQASSFEDSYRTEVENGTQEMLTTNEEAYSKFYDNLLNNKIQYALAAEAIDEGLSETQMQVAADGFGQIASLFGENTAAYKVMATAQATISTWLAAVNVLAARSILGPVVAGIAFAGTLATGLAAVAKINGVAFANGGIVSGPTNALIGEYAGARSNPEVVAPLDKLRSMMGGNMQRVEVYGYLDGDVIRLANKRSNYIADRRG